MPPLTTSQCGTVAVRPCVASDVCATPPEGGWLDYDQGRQYPSGPAPRAPSRLPRIRSPQMLGHCPSASRHTRSRTPGSSSSQPVFASTHIITCPKREGVGAGATMGRANRGGGFNTARTSGEQLSANGLALLRRTVPSSVRLDESVERRHPREVRMDPRTAVRDGRCPPCGGAASGRYPAARFLSRRRQRRQA